MHSRYQFLGDIFLLVVVAKIVRNSCPSESTTFSMIDIVLARFDVTDRANKESEQQVKERERCLEECKCELKNVLENSRNKSELWCTKSAIIFAAFFPPLLPQPPILINNLCQRDLHGNWYSISHLQSCHHQRHNIYEVPQYWCLNKQVNMMSAIGWISMVPILRVLC